jgi:zinc transporter, ZIP family
MEPLLLAFLFTLFAGLATGVGGLLAFFKIARNPKVLAISLGFSAGVMVYVSFVEILPKGVDSLLVGLPLHLAWALGVFAFFIGFGIAGVIDKLIPNHEIDKTELVIPNRNKKVLLRTGLFTALAITIHNFPEGLATFMATLQDPTLGFAIALAIAIHNIPEGIAVSVPILHATGSRSKALFYSTLSGLAEPVGAILGFLVLQWLFTDWTFGVLFCAVGGIMIYISIDELLPSAHLHGDHHHVIYGFACGMLVMAVSLVLLLF